MITRTEKIAMVVGSLILGLLNTMDRKQIFKSDTRAYTKYMRKSTRTLMATKKERTLLADCCRDSMLMMVEQFKDQESIMQVAIFVESLSFSFERELNTLI